MRYQVPANNGYAGNCCAVNEEDFFIYYYKKSVIDRTRTKRFRARESLGRVKGEKNSYTLHIVFQFEALFM